MTPLEQTRHYLEKRGGHFTEEFYVPTEQFFIHTYIGGHAMVWVFDKNQQLTTLGMLCPCQEMVDRRLRPAVPANLVGRAWSELANEYDEAYEAWLKSGQKPS